MNYQVQRDGQFYGPYTRQDLERYVTAGNVLPTDLAKSEEMPDWLPVSEILSTTVAAPPSAFTGNGYASPSFPQATQLSAYPDPPKLHWGLVLLFTVLTCGLFLYIWDIVQSLWMRKVQPASKSLFYYIAACVLLIPYWGSSFLQGLRQQSAGTTDLWLIPLTILILAGRFTLRSSLEEHFTKVEPMGLSLSGVMTFFFGTLYFQYHLTRIAERKQAERMSGGRGY